MSDSIAALDFQPEASWEALTAFFPAVMAALPPNVREALRASPGLLAEAPVDGWIAVNHRDVGWLFDVSAASMFTARDGLATFRLLRPDGCIDELVVEQF